MKTTTKKNDLGTCKKCGWSLQRNEIHSIAYTVENGEFIHHYNCHICGHKEEEKIGNTNKTLREIGGKKYERSMLASKEWLAKWEEENLESCELA